MKNFNGVVLTIGFLTLFLAALAATIIVFIGPGSMERALSPLGPRLSRALE
jgi:hypothetical protein